MNGEELIALAVNAALVIVLAVLGLVVVRFVSRQILRRIHADDAGRADRKKQLETLVQLGRWMANVAIISVALLMFLGNFVDIAPLLASLGAVGLAVSLGTQTLLKDFVGGLFILLEGQYNIGDVIQVGNVSGVVERLTLRATYVRDVGGKLHDPLAGPHADRVALPIDLIDGGRIVDRLRGEPIGRRRHFGHEVLEPVGVDPEGVPEEVRHTGGGQHQPRFQRFEGKDSGKRTTPHCGPPKGVAISVSGWRRRANGQTPPARSPMDRSSSAGGPFPPEPGARTSFSRLSNPLRPLDRDLQDPSEGAIRA